MSLRELQEALARALTDASLRTDPPALPLQLADIPADRLRAFAGVLDAKRRQRAQSALPLTSRLLGNRLPPLFAAYAAAHPPTEAARRAEVAAFADHAAAALRSEPFVAEGISGRAVAELMRYEALRHHLRRQPAPVAILLDPMEDDRLLDRRPVLGPAAAAGSFEVGVDRWLEALKTAPSAAPLPGSVNLLLARFPQPPLVRARRVNAATAAFLTRCDGGRTLEQTIDGLAWEIGADDAACRKGLREEALGLLRLLSGQGYVDWR